MQPLKNRFITLAMLLLSLNSWGAASRTIDADALISSAHTKTYTLPTISGSSDALATVTSSASFSNKTISGASNTFSNIPANTALTNQVPIANGGTGQSTKAAGFDALSPATTKGDLVVYSTTGARLGVGTDGQVLTADSTQTLGVKWATSSGGGTWTQEIPSGSCNGSNTAFTLANTPTSNGVVSLYQDRLILTQGVGKDYTISGASITLAVACSNGQSLYVVYTH